MTFQWSKNPEYTIQTWYDFTNWKLPFGINWRWFTDSIENKCFDIEVMFLCFGIEFEIWWWRSKKNLYDSVEASLKDLPEQPFKKGDIY